MAECVKETLCSRCIHRRTCKYTEEYIENFKGIESKVTNNFVFKPELRCIYYCKEVAECRTFGQAD